MNLKNYILPISSILFILYSVIAGLLIPLTPNIENCDCKENDSLLICNITTSKELGTNSVYLVKNFESKDKKKTFALKGNLINKRNKESSWSFQNPTTLKSIEKGDVFDMLYQSDLNNDMFFFEAFIVNKKVNEKPIENLSSEIKPYKSNTNILLPNRPILKQSIRNLFYHVPMWFAMIFMLMTSLYYSIKYLKTNDLNSDLMAAASIKTGVVFGIAGILTGMVWANYTWGHFWPKNDPKLDGAAIGLISYFIYLILRSSISDNIKRAKISSVYNIFAFTIYIVFIMILPRLKDSLHPGNGGNPGFNIYEQDNIMRLVFYPACIGWILFAFWLNKINYKIDKSTF